MARRSWSALNGYFAMAALFCTLQFGLMAKRAVRGATDDQD